MLDHRQNAFLAERAAGKIFRSRTGLAPKSDALAARFNQDNSQGEPASMPKTVRHRKAG